MYFISFFPYSNVQVWISQDGVPVVVHGGDNGELKDYGHPDDHVQDWTLDKLQQLDAGEGESLPTLESVFELFRGHVFVNIELKGPRGEEFKPKYCCKKAAEAVYALVVKHNYHGKFLVSSFGSDILEAVAAVRTANASLYPRFDIIYLYNYDNLPLPLPEIYTAHGDGINISANHITEEVVANCKRNNKKIGVWIRS